MHKTKKSDVDDEDFLANLTFGEDPVEHEKKLMKHYDRLAKDVLEEHFTIQVCPLLVCVPTPDHLSLLHNPTHVQVNQMRKTLEEEKKIRARAAATGSIRVTHTRTTQTDTQT